MRSSTHLELELQSNLPCTYESVSGDINVLFLLLVSSNKGFATCSPVNTRDKHDDNLNRSSLRAQDPPVSTYSRYKTNTMVTSGSNDGNEDDIWN
jgi:hypothetical protein